MIYVLESISADCGRPLHITAPTTTLTSFGEAQLMRISARHTEFVHRLTQLKEKEFGGA